MLGGRERVETKSDRTRRILGAVALELFDRYGYDEVSVGQIAAKAGVSRRTFFRHFASKDEVIFGRPGEVGNRLGRIVRESRAPDLLGPAREAVLDLATWIEEEVRESVVRSNLIFRTPILIDRALRLEWEWEAEIALGLAERRGKVTPGIRESMVAGWAMNAHGCGVRAWIASGGERSVVDATRQALAVFESNDAAGCGAIEPQAQRR